jgi:hypothetical protein
LALPSSPGFRGMVNFTHIDVADFGSFGFILGFLIEIIQGKPMITRPLS